jgi:AraC-like DNA-binding protein
LHGGDFMLVPAMNDLSIETMNAAPDQSTVAPIETQPGYFRIGHEDTPLSLRMRVGHCRFDSPDAALLVRLLPQVILARRENRLATLMQLLDEETRADRPARELVLERLLEVLLIEALRCGGESASAPGIARGLADDRLSVALRVLHAKPEYPWTVAELAGAASLSRSAFFVRFSRTVGLPPMEYLLAWRMALAQRLLRGHELSINQIAERVGYGSTSTFTTAFARHVGVPPARYSRMSLNGRSQSVSQ